MKNTGAVIEMVDIMRLGLSDRLVNFVVNLVIHTNPTLYFRS